MTELTDFLFARLDEDEEAAREYCAVLLARELEPGPEPFAFERGPGDPLRVLAKCAADRRIVELHPTYEQEPYEAVGVGMFYPPDPYYCDCQCPDGIIQGHEPCETKRLLALPFADHPDYQQEWKI